MRTYDSVSLSGTCNAMPPTYRLTRNDVRDRRTPRCCVVPWNRSSSPATGRTSISSPSALTCSSASVGVFRSVLSGVWAIYSERSGNTFGSARRRSIIVSIDVAILSDAVWPSALRQFAAVGRPYLRYSEGTTNMFNIVDVFNPHRMTIAIGVESRNFKAAGCEPGPSVAFMKDLVRPNPACHAEARIARRHDAISTQWIALFAPLDLHDPIGVVR